MFYIATFFIVGAILGGQINHAIYRFAFFSMRPISPWMKVDPKHPKRTWLDCIPIFGWTLLNREEKIHGNYFWLRPFFIEVACAFGLVGLYLFHVESNSFTPKGTYDVFPNAETTVWVWFAMQSILFGLLAIATFIDFDEFMIPDQVTIPGVLIFLIASAIYPAELLPNVENAGLDGRLISPLHFASPAIWPTESTGVFGEVAAIACIWFWCFALIPKTCTFRKGVTSFLPIMIASILQRPRKTSGTIKITPRRMYLGTPILAGIAIICAPAVVIFWSVTSDPNRISFLTAVLGMTFGMSMIWSIRLVGKFALGKEAMGFGDVTLMAMIGAYVGWQACLPILGVSAIAALFISVPMAIFYRESTLPYGPYLSIGAVVVVLFWPSVWGGWLKQVFEAFGSGQIFLALVVMTIPMFVLLLITRFVKERVLGLD